MAVAKRPREKYGKYQPELRVWTLKCDSTINIDFELNEARIQKKRKWQMSNVELNESGTQLSNHQMSN